MEKDSTIRTRASKDSRSNLAEALRRLQNQSSELTSQNNIYYNDSEKDSLTQDNMREKMSDFLDSVKKEQKKNNPVQEEKIDPALAEMELPDSTEEVTDNPLQVIDDILANKVEDAPVENIKTAPVKDEEPVQEEAPKQEPATEKKEVLIEKKAEPIKTDTDKEMEKVQEFVQKNTMPSEENIKQESFNKVVESSRTVSVQAPEEKKEAPLQKENSTVVKPVEDEESNEDAPKTHSVDEKEKEEFVDCQSLIGDDIKIGPVKRKKSTDEIDLSDLKIDLNNIQVTESPNLLHISKYIDNTFRPKSATQVVCMRSGYVAQMTDLNFADRDVLTGSADAVNYNRRKFKVIHSKIGGSSIGRMSFEEFLKVTAFSEIEILEYGIYAQTFPGKNSFDITCNSCHSVTKVAVEPSELVQMVNAKANFLKIQEILKSQVSKPLEILNLSMLRNKERIILPDCKAIVEVITPSCDDYLNHLSKYDANTMQDANETFGVMLYIGRIFVPNILILKNTGKLAFDEIPSRDFEQKFKIVSHLSNKDGSVLTKAINDRESLYTVQHRLRGVTCQNCKRDLGNINIDLENLLFHLIKR